MTTVMLESVVEDATLEWFRELGYSTIFGPDIAPDEPGAERLRYSDVVLAERLQAALAGINSHIPEEAREDAVRRLLGAGLDSPSPAVNNHRFHRFLVDGVPVEYQRDGRTVHDQVWLLDFADPDQNDWLAVNQFTVIDGRNNRRPDVVVFVNGLPLAVIELKNPGDENATVQGAFNQLQTYKQEIPGLFPYNEALVVSDGVEARLGTLTADWDRFMPWRTIEGDELAPKGTLDLFVLIKGVFERRRFLDLLQNFIVFEEQGTQIAKKMAAYHQFHAVNKALEATLQAASLGGDRRAGVVWHTQGSGKSLTMALYSGKLIRNEAMANPTLVVITDRNDLDGQLFEMFAADHELLRQQPVQAESREDLRERLRVASGGVTFTTIQKFFEKDGHHPALSQRRNIVVIADEAHRSQYDFIDGFARQMRDALPNASFIGFTGTPIETTDHSTRAVFGDYIDIYDIRRAVEDGATVPIYYEGRLAKIGLSEAERPSIDAEFDEVTEGQEHQQRLRSKWARLEALVGTERRLDLVARDIVGHFEQRLETLDGKGMVVCMSRRICVDLYNAVARLRPQWAHMDDAAGQMKVIMTGSASDPPAWQPHIRNKAERDALATRFKRPEDSFRLVIVRDMWLTGFDAPSLHTMYLDKPMRGHSFLQAIARVNRVFRDKPGGLVVDYLGLANELKQALALYTDGGGTGTATIDQAEAAAILIEKYEIVAAMFHGFDYGAWATGAPQQKLSLIPLAMEHILRLPDGKRRFMQAVTELSKAFALAVPNEEALARRDDVGFFQTLRARFAKTTVEEGKVAETTETAIRQLVSRAIVPEGVVDILSAAGLAKPDISILSGEFLQEVRDLPERNLAVELLRKLLNDEIKLRSARNVAQAKSFAEMLERAIRQYQNRLIESTQVIEELIEIAKQMQAAQRRGDVLGLTDDELAFYDALAANESAVEVLGDAELRLMAQELVRRVRANATIDWELKESSRAKLRLLVRNLLRRHRYPPDKRDEATATVLQQVEILSHLWAA
jgi:type I restriction enzyme R subunit